jgi:hypothetical protein
MSQKLTFDITVMHVPGRCLAGHSDQEMSHLGREVTQRENREHIRFVQETQLFDVRMHSCRYILFYTDNSETIRLKNENNNKIVNRNENA